MEKLPADFRLKEIYPYLMVKDLRSLSEADQKLKIDLSTIDQMLDVIFAPRWCYPRKIDHYIGDEISRKYWGINRKLRNKYRLSMLPKNLEKRALLHGFDLMRGEGEGCEGCKGYKEDKYIRKIESVLKSADKRAEREALETIFTSGQIKEIYDKCLEDIREYEEERKKFIR